MNISPTPAKNYGSSEADLEKELNPPRWFQWSDYSCKLKQAAQLFLWFNHSASNGRPLKVVLQRARFYAFGVSNFGPVEFRKESAKLLEDINGAYKVFFGND